MAAPLFVQPVDRFGLTVEEFDALNLHWEDASRREQEYQQLLLQSLRGTHLDAALPTVLLPEISRFLVAPDLPPVLQAQLEAKRKIEEQLAALMMQRQSLEPAMRNAAVDATNHLEFRLRARRQLKEHVARLEEQHGSASASATTVAPESAHAHAATAATSDLSLGEATASAAAAASPTPSTKPSQLKLKKQPAALKAAAQKPNKLLVPKWKQRTADTHARHLEQLAAIASSSHTTAAPRTLLLGDSMLERWQTTGADLMATPADASAAPRALLLGSSTAERWQTTSAEQLTPTRTAEWRIFNAGVGGDTVQNLLWRTTPGSSIDRRVGVNGTQPSGLFDHLPSSLECVVLFIGTNNIEKDQPAHIAEGVKLVLQQLLALVASALLPRLRRILVYALPYRTDVPNDRIDAYNVLLASEMLPLSPLITFTDELARAVRIPEHYDDHVHLNAAGYAVWWPILQRHMQVDGQTEPNVGASSSAAAATRK